jgi:hypothetical protein
MDCDRKQIFKESSFLISREIQFSQKEHLKTQNNKTANIASTHTEIES